MDRSASRSPPPMPPSSSILGNTVSSSVLFFNKNKSSSSSSSSRSSSISRSGSIKSKKSARFQSDLGKSGSIISNYDDGSTIEDADGNYSTSHGEFYVTANSNPSSSRGSLEEEDSNGSGTSSFSRLYNSTTSAFKRSFNFFEGMGHSEKGSSSNNSNNNSSQNSSSSNLSLGNSDARQQSSSLDQNNTFLLPPIWYHSNTAASFPFFPSSLGEKPLSLSNFVNHLQRKIVKSGFELTMMVIGEARLGKSTLVNSIFKSDIFPSPPPPPSSGDQHEAKQEMTAGRGLVETTTIHLLEQQVDLHLTLLEVTPNFGQNSEAAQTGARSVAQLIEGRFLEHLNTQSQVRRSQAIADKRVNACLYLVPPTGLTPGDVQCMLELHDKVNIIPVIAKADTLTLEELEGLKKSTMVLISGNHIKLYDFPEWAQVEASHEELLKVVEGEVKKIKNEKENNVKEEAAVNEQAESLDPLPPPSQPRLLAVIGSNEKIEVEGKLVRIRRYPWGVVEVESPHHCDLITLRRQLMHHLLDLREVTDAVFYDNFRKREYLLQKEIRERQSTLDSLQAHYMQELERLEEEHLTRLCQMEMDEVCYLERENEAKWQLQKDIAQLAVKKRKLEAGEEVDGEEQENVPPGANQGHTPGNGKNTIPKEKITPRTLGGALRELGSDIQRISSFKTPKPLRHLFSPSTNGGKEKRKTSNGF